MPFLACRHLDKNTQWNAELTADSFTIGCSEGASIPVPDLSLSAREVLVFRQGDRYRLRDLAEKDRVLLNGAVTRESVLRDADCVQIGRVLVRFFEDAPARGGQVVLYPETGNGSPPPPAPPASPQSVGELDSRPAAPPRAGRRLAPLVVLAAALLLGVLVGYYGGRRPSAPDGGPETVLRSRDAEGVSPPPTDLAPPAAETSGADPLERLRRQLDGAGAGPRVESPGAEKAGVERPGIATASAGGGAPSLGTPSRRAPDASPTAARILPLDPWVRKLSLHRLFLDVAGRPPTREEARRLERGSPKEWWEAALALAPAKPSWSDVPEDAVQALLGREATPGEARSIRDSGLPPAVFIAAGDEYGNVGRVRPRTPRQRATSAIVDLLDRPPTGYAEIEVLTAALSAPDSRDDVLRAVALSSSCRLPDEDGIAWWEEDVLRLLHRPPTEAERAKVPAILETLPREHRRRWTLLALARLPEYERY